MIKSIPEVGDKPINKQTDLSRLLSDLKSPCHSYGFAISIPNYIKKKMGIETIGVGTSEEFEDYDKWLKSNHPYVYWIEEVFMDKFQDAFCFLPKLYREVKYNIKNRFFTKPHYLNTGLKKGSYYEIDERIIHGLFNTLKIYIEEELSNYAQIFYSEEMRKERKKWSNAQHAIDYIEWEIKETSKEQSDAAKEKLELYKWWTEVYPNRVDPYDLVIWEEDEKPFQKTVVSYAEKYGEFEKETKRQNSEDEEMMIRLIKLRYALWT